MRLHELRVQAFGPFASTATVDLDELSDAGLFLLSGATGAGKTSVLDAICFALYGEVPGDRHEAKHLRSDQAEEGLAPEVSLVLSVRGRTFRFTRSPAWQRPKRRGTGTTPEHAKVLVEEQRDAGWRTLTTRIDDAGLLVGDLLGMTCLQFTQVAMLPQGRFQAFLRATSTERHAVLQRLFRTDRFERVEHWLADHRTDLRRASERAAAAVTALVHRTQEVATCPVPDDWDLGDLADPAGDGRLASWAAQQVTSLAARADAAELAASSAHQRLDVTRAAHADGLRVAGLRQRLATARAELEALAVLADETAALRDRLEADERARPLVGLVERSRAADAAAAQARRSTSRALEALGLVTGATADDAELLRSRLVAREAELEAARPLADDVATAHAAAAEARAQEAALTNELDALLTAAAARPGRLQALEVARTAVVAASAALAGLRARHAQVCAGAEAREQATVLAVQVVAARAALANATTRAQDLREAYQDAREARITAMAGELAGALASGCACPVCGSTSHPHLAASSAVHGREQEEQARRTYEDAELARSVAVEELTALEVRLQGVEALAGDLDLAGWRSAVREVSDELTEVTAVAARGTAVDAEVAHLREAEALDSARAEALRSELGAVHERAIAARERVETGTARLAEALHDESLDEPCGEALAEALTEALTEALAEALAEVRQRRAAADAAVRALGRRDELVAAARELAGAADAAALDAGFADAAAVLAAVLDDASVAQARQAIADRERRAQAAQAVLGDVEVQAAAAQPAPDLEGLTLALDDAERTARDADSSCAAARRDRERVVTLVAELDAALDAWAPVRERHAAVAALAAFAEGKSVDNTLRMRLSAYVLSERLRQVVASANERLTRMTESRYTLLHTDERGVGAQRGGLSLMVRDEWSGVERDPATLSGGETFVVSLALALGLADTVVHEAGGTDIDTLFIDEGFGSLDADTLDDVLDTLDALREGGRVVGVVSHVGEMRERIPARLEVRKSPRGSTLAGVGTR